MSTAPWHPYPGSAPLICGHRGASAVQPENTVAAAVQAARDGATWIEFDVRPSGDAGLVVHHDPVTADGTVIATTGQDQLDSAVPSFQEFVSASRTLGLDIEMKSDQIDMSVESFAELVAVQIDTHCADRRLGQLIVTSFDMGALDAFHRLRPAIATGVLFHEETGEWAIAKALAMGHTAIVPWFELVDRKLVGAAHAAGLGVVAWTLNQVVDMRAVTRAGVDMIIGDDPAHIISTLTAMPSS